MRMTGREALRLLGPGFVAARGERYDEPDPAPEPAGRRKGGPKFWMRKLTELLAAMMKDPQIQRLTALYCAQFNDALKGTDADWKLNEAQY